MKLDGKEITTNKILLENEEDNKKKFISSMCFLTYEDIQEFKNKDPNERITLFYEAKSI